MAKRGTVGWRCSLKIGQDLVGEAKDVNISLERGEIDVSSYDSTGWRQTEAGLAQWGGDFTLLYKVPQTEAAEELFESFVNGTPIEDVQFLREDGSGYVGTVVILSFSEERPFEGAVARRINFRGSGVPTQIAPTAP